MPEEVIQAWSPFFVWKIHD